MGRRVVVTGRGVVSPCGTTPGDLHAALCAGEPLLGPPPAELLAEKPNAESLARLPVGAVSCDLRQALAGRNLRPLDRTSMLLVLAAGLALEEAGWDEEERQKEDVGLVVGTLFCSLHTIAAFDRRALVDGPGYASPLDFSNTVINAAAGQTAIWHGLRGISSTVAGEAAAGLEALAYAADLIRSGRSRALLVGGVEELSFEGLFGFSRLGWLAGADGAEPFPVPFAERRNGFALAEGAALLMLEDRELAMERGATILAEVLGSGRTFDPSLASDEERAVSLAVRSMRLALQEGKRAAGDVAAVSTSANGAPAGDRIVARSLASLFGESTPPVTAPKGVVGESLGAGGGLQAVAILGSMADRRLPVTVRAEELDPGLPLAGMGWDPSAELDLPLVMLQSVGFGGHLAALLLAQGGGAS